MKTLGSAPRWASVPMILLASQPAVAPTTIQTTISAPAFMGAQMVKEVASKTSDVAGDGTTTATVLAQSICNEGFKFVAAGMSRQRAGCEQPRVADDHSGETELQFAIAE